jgi:hypothetical protein
MTRDPGDISLSRPRRTRQVSAAGVRLARAYMIVLFLCGVVLAGIALLVFSTQGSQIQVTAKVLSERCHPQTDLATHQAETRCDADVEFTAVNSRTSRATTCR